MKAYHLLLLTAWIFFINLSAQTTFAADAAAMADAASDASSFGSAKSTDSENTIDGEVIVPDTTPFNPETDISVDDQNFGLHRHELSFTPF